MTHSRGLQHIAPLLSSPYWTQLQDLLLPTLMVPSKDLKKTVLWCELNHLSSSERRWSKIGTVLGLLKYSEGMLVCLLCDTDNHISWTLMVQFPLHYIIETVLNHLLVVRDNILSDLLEGWCFKSWSQTLPELCL